MQINISKETGTEKRGVAVKNLRQGLDQLRPSADLDFIPITPRIGVEFKVGILIKISDIEEFYRSLAEFMKKWE